jgi:membrane-bound metal-dependent hydrolase YbcI (DUF457 family)
MNKRGHVLNALLLGVGVGLLLEPTPTLAAVEKVAEVTIPVVLGALFPDVDTAFGKHRKTLHNLLVLAVVGAYPIYFGNLQWVWLGVVTHYVLDVLGTTRGIALFYPLWSEEFNVPIGVTVDHKYADIVMLVITGFELAIAAFLIFDMPSQLTQAGLQAAGMA